MTLNSAQLVAPLNSGQVLDGYSQGVRQGTGITIQPDGTITLNPDGAATLGFLTSSSAPAPIYNWSLAPGLVGSLLRNDGAGNLNWTNDYVVVYPQVGTTLQTGAAALPAGDTVDRPSGAQAGWLRYNTSNGNPEFFNGGGWIATTRPQGPVLSFVSNLTPTATNAGDLWLDTNTNQEKVWSGTAWVPTSPAATSIIPGLVTIGANVQNTDGVISILDSTTAQKGVVQLNNTTTTDDPTLALTAAQGYYLQQQITTLVIAGSISLAGIISGAGILTRVTPEGILAGFVLGDPLPAPIPRTNDYFVICESDGGFTPPGGAFTVVTKGDWFISSGGVWIFLNIGVSLPVASTTIAGIVRLSTNAETQTGTDDTIAVTPASLSSRVATETLSGLLEVATQAEANAGTNDAKTITPLKLANVFGSGSIDATDIKLNPSINGNTTVQQALDDSIYNVASSNNSIVVAETAVGQIVITAAQATEVQSGVAQIAAQAEANAGINDAKIITPLKLANVFGSGSIDATDIKLNPSINGNTTVQQALDDSIYNVASSNNSIVVAETAVGQVDVIVRQATESQLGGAQIAAQVEANAGINDAKIITPLKLANVFGSGSIDATDIKLNPSINGNTTVQQALDDSIYNVASSNNSIVVAETAVGQVDVIVRQATESQLGGGQIATQVQTEGGGLDTVLVTPLKLRTAAVYKSDFNAKGDILSASANNSPLIQSVGADGLFLIADSTTATGLNWGSPTPTSSFYIANLDDISGSFNGVTTGFSLAIAGVPYAPSPTSNIVVFLGGVAQTPGASNAYTVVGSTLNFASAPPAGASFYANTVRN